MEIIKNNKTYFYNTPTDKDYTFIVNILSDFDIIRCRINYKYCILFSDKKIKTKLKKFFKNITYDGIDMYDNKHIYTINYIDYENS